MTPAAPARSRRWSLAAAAIAVVLALVVALLVLRGGATEDAGPADPSIPPARAASEEEAGEAGGDTGPGPDPTTLTAPTTPVATDPPAAAPDPGAPLQPGGDVEVLAPVEEALAAEGEAKVIVDLGLPDDLAQRPIEERDALVAAAVDQALAPLPEGSYTDAQPLNLVGAVALTLDPAGLAALEEAQLVERVEPDLQHEPTSANAPVAADAPDAWAQGADGDGMVVAVLDTGVEAGHLYFARDGGSRIVAEACFTYLSCPGGTDLGFGPGSAAPCTVTGANCAHGTHVAGIAVGGTGATLQSGYANQADLIAVQVFSRYAGGITAYSSDITAALGWLYDTRADHPGLAAVNLSLGGGLWYASEQGLCDTHYSTAKAAIDALRSAGIATVISSGNDRDPDQISGPGCISSAIAVGSVDDEYNPLRLSGFSNHNAMVDVLAPGSSITSSVPYGSFGSMSGTSMAAPAISGAIAALAEAAPSSSVSDRLAALQSTGLSVSSYTSGAAASPSRRSVRLEPAVLSVLGGRPTAARALLAAPALDGITATWSPAIGGSPPTSYTATALPAGTSCTVPAGVVLSCTLAGVSPGQANVVEVVASNASGVGLRRTSAAVVPFTLPGAPAAVSAFPGDGQAIVSWSPPASDGFSALTEYTVVASPGGASCTTAALDCTIGGLANGTAYTFAVRASNVAGPGPAASSQVVVPEPTSYRSMAPARFMDTREIAEGGATIDGLARGEGELGAGEERLLDVTGRAGVPASGVGAVALNVTVANPTAWSNLRVYPSGAEVPTASNLNFAAGQTVPNMVIARVGPDGQIALFNESGTTEVIVDVLGWFPEGQAYEALTPARLMDTRPPSDFGSTIDGQCLGQGQVGDAAAAPRRLRVTGRGGVPASGVGAVVLNVTAANPTAWSNLRAYPKGTSRPTASNLNYAAGQTVPNMVIAKVGADGEVLFSNEAGSTDVIVDVMGWIPAGSGFAPQTPGRIMDTRSPLAGGSTVDGEALGGGRIGQGSTRGLLVAGRAGVPSSGVGAVALNVTVTNPTRWSNLRVFPSGSSVPTASNLNYAAGQTVPNMVIARVGPDGRINLFNEVGSTDVVVDVLGWFPA